MLTHAPAQLALFVDPAPVDPAPRPALADLVAEDERRMAIRAAKIRALVIANLDAAQIADLGRQLWAMVARRKQPLPGHDAAIFWHSAYDRIVAGRTNSWCVQCDQRTGCPVLMIELEEVLEEKR